MTRLVITEKPSVAREIASVLGTPKNGEGYIQVGDVTLTWAVGHLLQLAEPDSYKEEWKRWNFDDLPIMPDEFQIQPIDSSAKKQLNIIRKLSKGDWDEVVNACDAGREGELIFARVRDYCAIDVPIRRLWLASLTSSAIKKAWDDLHPASDYAQLEDAAQARAEADWLVGMNATRAASIKLRGAFTGRQVLSIGRVQTPTLRLIVDRELQIKAFVPEVFWTLDALFAAPDGDYWGRLTVEKQDRLAPELVSQAESETAGATGTITDLQKKEVSEQSPLLYDLTSLQREANNKFGFTAKRTLQTAQRLYEQYKMLTYPRTDSRYVTADVAEEFPSLLKKLQAYSKINNDLLDITPRTDRCVNEKKVSDHHAIIPTGIVKDLPDDEAKLYDLVLKRFVANLHENALVERTTLTTTVGAWGFRSKGRIILKPGWRAVYGEEAVTPGEDLPDQALPPLTQGLSVTLKKHDKQERQTKPPSRFSDASLLGAMETAGKTIEDEELKEAMKDGGLGTPATRAAIIETLLSREYVERKGKQLAPTEKGVLLIQLLQNHLLTSPELTGGWEKNLNQIASGETDVAEFRASIRTFLKETVEQFDGLSTDDVPRAELGPCPHCGKTVRENRKGYSCWTKDDATCGFVIWKELAGRTITPEEATQLMNEGITDEIEGWGIGNDQFSSRIKLDKDAESGKWIASLPDAPAHARVSTRESIGACVSCGKDVFENRKAYSCWRRDDPGCGVVIWKQQSGVFIDTEHAQELLTNKKTAVDGKEILITETDGTWSISIDGTTKALAAGGSTRESAGKCVGCGKDTYENKKAYSCWQKSDPGCGVVLWKQQDDVFIDAAHAKKLMADKKTTIDDKVVTVQQGDEGWTITIDGSTKSIQAPGKEKKPKKAAAKKPAAKKPAAKKTPATTDEPVAVTPTPAVANDEDLAAEADYYSGYEVD